MNKHFQGLVVAVAAAGALSCVGCNGPSGDGASLPAQANLSPQARFTSLTTSGGPPANASLLALRNLNQPSNSSNAAASSGSREVNFDDVPDAGTATVANATNVFPGDFYSVNSTRGLVLATPGTGLRVSDNNFSTVDPSYSSQFTNLTPPKTLAPIGSNVVDVLFNRVGSNDPAAVTSFGAVFSDVDNANTTSLEFFDFTGASIGTVFVPVRSDSSGLSFAGATTASGVQIARVRITLGNGVLAAGTRDISGGGTVDLVVLDNLIYSEPQAVPYRVTLGSGLDVTGAVHRFQADLGGPNNGASATSAASGRREINWDGVPTAQQNTTSFPGDFFNTTSPRGVVLDTPGTGFSVSNNDFAFVDPSYNSQFRFFSPSNTFQAVGSAVTNVNFRLPGTSTAASSAGFGAVFSDIDQAGSGILEFFDASGNGLGTFAAPVRTDPIGDSFLGVKFPAASPARKVRITAGQGALGAGIRDLSDGGSLDLGVLDDFLYGEPH